MIVLKFKVTSIVSFPLILFLAFLVAYQIKKSAYPASFYGVTWKNWKKNTFEGIVFSLPIMILCTILKWYFFGSKNFINFASDAGIFSQKSLFIVLKPYLYTLLTPIQEFIARSGVQKSITVALKSKYPSGWPNILANLIFSAMHAFISIKYAIAAFVAGMFWGWLFQRQNSLVGPSISHALIGWWIISVLGLGQMMTT